ncbi:putative membrane protein required for colicin V production [Arthrobacter stackebrandtii]|uniref:Membrane protein required for colicin V production n=1 Tax=Arthrobacter stackebrandtii TaxID=272161 RepID=A0ABS4YUE4_9MICC|nr:putative membrane protein required for colicin V production [Arthrobacter stackebrandtii]PYH02180.1 serine protease [Arthrobacter stackebrandtii]
MFGFSWLDVLLVLWLLWQLIYGLNVGLVASLGGIAGFAAGAVAAFFAAPFVSQFAPSPGWRTVMVIAATIVLMALGHAIGMRLGNLIGGGVRSGSIKAVNRILGGALNVVVGALIVSMLAFGVSNLGIPAVSSQLGKSQVLSAIDTWTPDPVKAGVAQIRSLVLEEGIPALLDPSGPNVEVAAPDADTNTDAWNTAARSVMKISGTAFQCGQNQTGTGFVVSPGRVLTNAHVVSGVTEPVVQTQQQGALPARVVFFDPVKDLAVLAVDGLDAAPLPSSGTVPANTPAAFAGYPLGGPLQVRPAVVRSSGPMMVPDIAGGTPSLLDVYQLAGQVQSGNSGGPLLDTAGNVVGVVFAKSTNTDNVGFALTMEEAGPVIAAAPHLVSAVASGVCKVG